MTRLEMFRFFFFLRFDNTYTRADNQSYRAPNPHGWLWKKSTGRKEACCNIHQRSYQYFFKTHKNVKTVFCKNIRSRHQFLCVASTALKRPYTRRDSRLQSKALRINRLFVYLTVLSTSNHLMQPAESVVTPFQLIAMLWCMSKMSRVHYFAAIRVRRSVCSCAFCCWWAYFTE